MDAASAIAGYGNVVKLARTDARHIAGVGETAQSADARGPEQGFGNLLFNALNGVNASQNRATDLSELMITDPDSVSVNDVIIAAAEANLAISMTKAIVDRALTAYREIINVR